MHFAIVRITCYLIYCVYWFGSEFVFRKGRALNKTQAASDKDTTTWTVRAIQVCWLLPEVVCWLVPSTPTDNVVSVGILLSVMLLSIYFRWASMSALGESFTRTLVVAKDQKIVSRGLYNHVRHPGYVGNFLLFVPGCYLLSNCNTVFAVLIFAMLCGVYHHRTTAEEQMLLSDNATATQYKAYTNVVRYRLMPYIY